MSRPKTKNKQIDAAVATRDLRELKAVSISGATVSISAAAAADGGASGARKFEVLAYSGGPIEVDAYDLPIVVDLDGLSRRTGVVANLDHVRTQRVGHTTEVLNDKRQLHLSGLLSAATQYRDEVVNSADAGFEWQASIEAMPSKVVTLKEGQSATVNGQKITGPAYIARKAKLTGFAFVSAGADDKTKVTIAGSAKAMESKDMDPEFVAFVESLGLDAESLSDDQAKALQANFAGKKAKAKKAVGKLGEVLAEQDAEDARQGEIASLTASALADFPDRAEAIKLLATQASENRSINAQQFELNLLRACRAQAQTVMSRGHARGLNGRVLEAALAKSIGIEVNEKYDEQTLDATDKHFRHGLGLQELLLMGARENGYTGLSVKSDVKGVLKACFRDPEIQASGFSSISVPGTLSTVANKVAIDAFNAVESVWRAISAIGTVSDFKQIKGYALSGDLTYKEVGKGGEIDHGTLGETEYSNQAKLFGRMLALTFVDIKNDDLGAFAKIPKRLGRGGALKINEVFWKAFLNNLSFFTSARANWDDGADTAFNSDGLARITQFFEALTDPDGNLMGTLPKILLVPPAHKFLAMRLLRSTTVGDADQATGFENQGTFNVWGGAYQLASSPYMAQTSQFTGASATGYYLLADPNDVPVVETVFLDGQQTPMIESAEADFDVLGIQFRGWHAFGVALQEYRGGVRFEGA